MGRPGFSVGVRRVFWWGVRAGLSVEDAAVSAGVSVRAARRWFGEAGGMCSVGLGVPSGRYLSLAEREQIALGVAAGETLTVIAERLGRPVCTISREVRRNACSARSGYVHHGSTRFRYVASVAQARAEEKARRPKQSKFAGNPRLRHQVQTRLQRRDSPEQIAGRLRREFPDDLEMRVSHETIYRSLYVQGRGELRRELTRCLRTGRAIRKPRRTTDQRASRIKDMVMISERPAEVADRAVPGHWEGDLILGAENKSAIGTLVERATGFCLLLHLPDGHTAEAVQHAMITTMRELPEHLRLTLTWDQGRELANHAAITEATKLSIYFCDPHSPWQRGSNENTNGLLRQYFPKGTNLSFYGPDYLHTIAAELNNRPRKRHNYQTPAEKLDQLLTSHPN